MKFKRYFNENNNYIEPTLVSFANPIKIKLSELRDFLDSYKPFACSDVYLYERFEYGDFDNWVEGIIESKTVDASFSRVYRKPRGIFKKGQTQYSIRDTFWHYRPNYPFWKFCPQVGYNDGYNNICRHIDKVEIMVYGVYIISWTDKTKIEDEYNKGGKQNG